MVILKHARNLLPLALWASAIHEGQSMGRTQVPGLVRSENGYDTLLGKEALCWFAPSFHEIDRSDSNENLLETQKAGSVSQDFTGTIWKDSLKPEFVSGPTTLMRSCPEGTSLEVNVVEEKIAGTYILRTGHFYTFRINAKIDLGVLRRQFELSDDAFFEGAVGVMVQFCPVREITLSIVVFSEKSSHNFSVSGVWKLVYAVLRTTRDLTISSSRRKFRRTRRK